MPFAESSPRLRLPHRRYQLVDGLVADNDDDVSFTIGGTEDTGYKATPKYSNLLQEYWRNAEMTQIATELPKAIKGGVVAARVSSSAMFAVSSGAGDMLVYHLQERGAAKASAVRPNSAIFLRAGRGLMFMGAARWSPGRPRQTTQKAHAALCPAPVHTWMRGSGEEV